MRASTTALGADLEQMTAIAEYFASSASRFENLSSQLQRDVAELHWFGPDADHYRKRTDDYQRLQLQALVSLLQVAAKKVRDNADAQREVSRSDGGSLSFQDRILQTLKAAAERAREHAASIEAVESGFLSMLGKSPAEQLAWWQSLSPDQQAYALANLGIYRLAGLPPDVVTQSLNDFVKKQREEIADVEASTSVEGNAKLRVFVRTVNLGFGIFLTMRVYPSGRTEVDVAGELSGGAGVEKGSEDNKAEAGINARGRFTKRFEFANRADAEKLLRDLEGNPTAFQKIMKEYNAADEAKKDEVELGVDGKIELTSGGQKIKFEGGVSVTKQIGGDLTVAGSAKLSAELGANNVAVSGSGEIGLSMTADPAGNVKSVKATFTLAAQGSSEREQLEELLGPGIKIESSNNSQTSVGMEMKVSCEWNMEDPATAQRVGKLIEDFKQHKVSLSEVRTAMNEATVVAQVSSQASHENTKSGGVNVGVAEASYEYKETGKVKTTNFVLIKPAGSTKAVRA